MPDLSKESVLAVLVSDIHLSMKRPISRVEEMEWFDVMAHYLDQLKKIAKKFDAPVICGGDVFDKWNAPPELINFALEHLPTMYSVPGQHDLPNHAYEDMDKSAYGTLVRAGKIINLEEGSMILPAGAHKIVLHGFPWNTDIVPADRSMATHALHVAVIHKYVWIQGKSFPGAPNTNQVTAFKRELKGYDVALFGDNHKGFTINSSGCSVHNNGGFIRRKIDEVDYHPCVGLLLEDGTVKRLRLNTSIDVFEERASERESEFDMADFITSLQEAESSDIDFRDVVEGYIRRNDVKPEVSKIIKECLDGHQ